MAELLMRMRRELKFHFASHPLCPNGVTVNLGVFVKGGVFFGVNPGLRRIRNRHSHRAWDVQGRC